jgi:GNAT superfamily N-acetyltransferase
MTPRPQAPIRVAGPDDDKRVVDVLAVALAGTEIAAYLVPDPVQRARVYRAYFELVVPWFLHYGHVDLAGDGAGAALWARCPGRFEPRIDNYDERLAHATGTAYGRFVELDAVMHTHHLDAPHQYLAFLGVDPRMQSAGTGSALLAHHHALLDAEGSVAYLEATGPRNTRLYHRQGYMVGTPYPIGPGGPVLTPMRRVPHQG